MERILDLFDGDEDVPSLDCDVNILMHSLNA
jgi:hypothetical protein